jgi:uridine kinase
MTTPSITIVGIAGGSGSGKTTFARLLHTRLGSENAVILGQDSYYIDQSSQFTSDGEGVNYDHPNAIDFTLLASHLELLRKGQSIDVPSYNFSTHSRNLTFKKLAPMRVVIVDGILVLHSEIVRNFFDHKIFIETDEALRFERRLDRDQRERGRTPEGVRRQFLNQVKPMHDRYVEPSRLFADQVISGQEPFKPMIEELAQRLMPAVVE